MHLSSQPFFSVIRLTFSSIVAALLAFAVLNLIGCRQPSGPIHAKESKGENLRHYGYYHFTPEIRHLNEPQSGELWIGNHFSGERGEAVSPFALRIIGRTAGGGWRIHSYEGEARRLGGANESGTASHDIIELRTERCYHYAKRNIEDRQVAIRRWSCDHLRFRFAIDSTPAALAANKDREVVRLENSGNEGWPGPIELEAIALAEITSEQRRRGRLSERPFALQYLETIEDQRGQQLLFWGFEAARMARPGDRFVHRHEPQRVVELTAISGDFAVARVVDTTRARAARAASDATATGDSNGQLTIWRSGDAVLRL